MIGSVAARASRGIRAAGRSAPARRRAALRGVAALVALASGPLSPLGCGEPSSGRGALRAGAVPAPVVERRMRERHEAAAAVSLRAGVPAPPKQVLFGDLHVHTTFSPDAFAMSLPLMGGEGARPPAMACDYARYCSALDFWSLNDHAEGVTPRRWRESIEAIRECNAAAGPAPDPDLVSFLGWEWTQVAWEPERHYGHKNVVLRETDPGRVPRRAIAAPREQLGRSPIARPMQLLLAVLDWEHRRDYLGIQAYYDEIERTPLCPPGVDTRELPASCLEIAHDPQELFEKLAQWGGEAVVIPHGNAWGLNTPPGTTFDKQLTPAQHDPQRQRLIEVYSGHGNSEQYRSWRHVERDASGALQCPAPRDDFLPCCWRAGEIVRERCLAAGLGEAECARREREARRRYVDASVTGYWTVPGTRLEDWLDCGQCRDCFNPPMDHRPGTSTQYALALSRPPAAPGGDPLRFRFGLIGSSDTHRARAGNGYKEFARAGNTDAPAPRTERLAATYLDEREPEPGSVPYEHGVTELGLQKARHMERQASFFLTGGLVAVHAAGRSRDAIWDALQRKEVYATSGDRILLWFDALTPQPAAAARAPAEAGAPAAPGLRSWPMGSALRSAAAPRFRVRAVGAFEQRPGCPPHAHDALGEDGIADLCLGECYHPSDRRRVITRIEVVRIRPQISPDEPVDALVEDPWRVLPCPGDPAGCHVDFEDPDFAASGRDALYYVRAIQEPTPAVNAGNLRCERDAQGRCVRMQPCTPDRVARDDDCLWPNEERAWSSPIFVDHAAGFASGGAAATAAGPPTRGASW